MLQWRVLFVSIGCVMKLYYIKREFQYNISQKFSLSYPAWKTKRVSESLAKSHAYNSIRDSWRDFSRSSSVSPKVSDWIVCMTLGKTLSETRFFTWDERYFWLQGEFHWDWKVLCNFQAKTEKTSSCSFWLFISRSPTAFDFFEVHFKDRAVTWLRIDNVFNDVLKLQLQGVAYRERLPQRQLFPFVYPQRFCSIENPSLW